MKKNICLTLLCLSAAVGQNVMGVDNLRGDVENVMTWSEMSPINLKQSDLDHIDSLIDKYKNTDYVTMLQDARNEIARKIKEGQNVQAPVAQQQNSVKNNNAAPAAIHSQEQPTPLPQKTEMSEEETQEAGNKYAESVLKIHATSVSDLIKDPKINDYLKAISYSEGPVGNLSGVDINNVMYKALALRAIKSGDSHAIKTLPQEARKFYKEYSSVKNNPDNDDDNDLSLQEALLASQESFLNSQKSRESDESDLAKAIEENKKTEKNRKNYVSDEDFEKLSFDDRAKKFPSVQPKESWRIALKNANLDEEEKAQIRRAPINASPEGEVKNLKKIKRQAEKQNKQTALRNNIGKLSTSVASELRHILKAVEFNDQDDNSLEVLMMAASKEYLNKSARDKNQFISDFEKKIGSFLTEPQAERRAVDDEQEPFKIQDKKELLDVMKKTAKYVNIALHNESLNKKIQALIAFVDKKSISSVLGDVNLGNAINRSIRSLSKTFGLSRLQTVKNFIQNQKKGSDSFGLEQVKGLVTTLIPDTANATKTVCENVTEKLGSKKRVLENLIVNIVKKTEPFYATFGLTAHRAGGSDKKDIVNFIDARINGLVEASKVQLEEIQAPVKRRAAAEKLYAAAKSAAAEKAAELDQNHPNNAKNLIKDEMQG